MAFWDGVSEEQQAALQDYTNDELDSNIGLEVYGADNGLLLSSVVPALHYIGDARYAGTTRNAVHNTLLDGVALYSIWWPYSQIPPTIFVQPQHDATRDYNSLSAKNYGVIRVYRGEGPSATTWFIQILCESAYKPARVLCFAPLPDFTETRDSVGLACWDKNGYLTFDSSRMPLSIAGVSGDIYMGVSNPLAWSISKYDTQFSQSSADIEYTVWNDQIAIPVQTYKFAGNRNLHDDLDPNNPSDIAFTCNSLGRVIFQQKLYWYGAAKYVSNGYAGTGMYYPWEVAWIWYDAIKTYSIAPSWYNGTPETRLIDVAVEARIYNAGYKIRSGLTASSQFSTAASFFDGQPAPSDYNIPGPVNSSSPFDVLNNLFIIRPSLYPAKYWNENDFDFRDGKYDSGTLRQQIA